MKDKGLENRLANFRVSGELFRELLHLPNGTELLDIQNMQSLGYHDVYLVTVAHPDFPVVKRGEKIPLIDPTVHNECGQLTFNFNYPEREDDDIQLSK